MSALARMVVLDLRTTAPYRWQGLLLFGICVAVLAGNRPVVIVPALVLLLTSQFAAYPFQIGDKAGLETLYAVLPVARRTVLAGHYAWALTCFAVTAAVGTAVTLVAGAVRSAPIGGRELLTTVTLAWAIFVVNVAIQFPLFIRFGYSRISLMSTFLPIAVIMMALTRMHLRIVSFATLQEWLPVIWVAGAAVIGVSVAVAVSAGGHWRFAAPARG
jgi:hypothetical protein